MKTNTNLRKEPDKNSSVLTRQDLAFVRLAAEILNQSEDAVVETLLKIRSEARAELAKAA